MLINVRSLSGVNYEIDSPSSSSVLQVKELLSPRVQVPAASIGLIFAKRELSDDESVPCSGDSFMVYYDRRSLSLQPRAPLLRNESKVCAPAKDSYDRNIPFNIEDLITYICAMQFTREQALNALQYTGYDINETVSLLLYGSATGTDGKKHSALEAEKSDEIYSYDDDGKDMVSNPNMELVKERTQINEFSKKMSELTEDERADVEKLHKMFSNYEQLYAYQIYIVNNKNFDAAVEMLSSEKT